MKKLYQVFLFLILLFFTNAIEAQERFERRYPVVQSHVVTTSLESVGEGYVMIGIERNAQNENENINLSFLDQKGTVDRSISIFYGDDIQIKNAGEVIRLVDGTFVFSAILAKDSLNKVVTRIDGFGNHFWTVITGQETDLQNLNSAPSLLIEVPNEGIFHAHIIQAENNTTDIQLTGINDFGDIEFVRQISLQNESGILLNERFMKMQLAVDSTIMILGTTDDPERPVFLTKMDTMGNIIWTRSYNGDFGRTLDTEGYDLVQLIDGSWVILGSVMPSITRRHGGFLLKIDENGNLIRTESISPSSVRYQLYPNGIIGTTDTSVVVALKRLDMISDIVQPMVFKYDLDSIIAFQTLLDTVINEDLPIADLVSVDSISATYLSTTLKDNFMIPYLAKVDGQGHTDCEESIMAIIIDTANFTRDTLSSTITSMIVEDSIEVVMRAFGRYDPPVLVLRDTTYCPQDPVNYFVDATVRGGVLYVWGDGNTESMRTFTEEGMHMVTVTVREDICFTLCDTLTITQLEFPEVTIVKNFDSYCSNGSGILVASFMGASIQNFEWSTGSTEPFIVVDGTPMGYSVTVTDGCGNSADASTTVSESDYLQPNPLGLEVSNDNLCVDGTLRITATTQSDPSLISWSTGESNTLSISISTPGDYSADVGGFCPDSEAINISAGDFVPPVDGEIIFECGNPGILRVAGTGFISQTWSTGETTGTIGISQSGLYSVTLKDECGNDQTPLEFTVTPEDIDNCTNCDVPCLIWPNAFQPENGDPDNTSFGPKLRSVCSTGLASYELQIFNRWGKNIFTSTSVDVKWNGAINGDPQPGGVYFYWSRYNDGTTTCERQGDVTLLR